MELNKFRFSRVVSTAHYIYIANNIFKLFIQAVEKSPAILLPKTATKFLLRAGFFHFRRKKYDELRFIQGSSGREIQRIYAR